MEKGVSRVGSADLKIGGGQEKPIDPGKNEVTGSSSMHDKSRESMLSLGYLAYKMLCFGLCYRIDREIAWIRF